MQSIVQLDVVWLSSKCEQTCSRVCSLLPLVSLTTKNGDPLARYLQVDCRFIGQVVQIRRLARFGNCHLNLSPLVPFIEGGYGDEIGLGL